MAADPKYGRRDFLKDSVVSVAKAAREFAAHKDAPRCEQTGCVRRVLSMRPCFLNGARAVAIALKYARQERS